MARVQLAEQHCPEQLPDRNDKTYEYLVTEKVCDWADVDEQRHCFKGSSVPPN
jgi:hypothetical protein